MRTYNRVNHFREVINQVQGKSYTKIPNDVINVVAVNLDHNSSGDKHSSEVYDAVRTILKSHQMVKYGNDIPKIVTMITGQYPPISQWSSHDIERLVHTFTRIQSFLELDRQLLPTPNRTTFPFLFLLEKVSHLARVTPKFYYNTSSSTKHNYFEHEWTGFMLRHFAKL